MVVIVIIGLLATLVVPNVLQKFAVASRKKAQVDLVQIKNALTEYAVNNGGKFPDSLEVLVTPDVNGHTYLDQTKIPKDPWGREYMYEPPGRGNRSRACTPTAGTARWAARVMTRTWTTSLGEVGGSWSHRRRSASRSSRCSG